MTELNKFLSSKKSLFIAFVPILNIAYFLYAFFMANRENAKYNFFEFFPLLAGAILWHFLPDNMWWIAIYAAVTGESLILWRFGMNNGYSEKFGKNAVIMLAALVVTVAAAALILGMRSNPKNTKKIEQVITAVMNDEQAQWKELIYPECEKDIKDVEKLRTALKAQGIEGTIENVKIVTHNFEMIDKTKTNVYEATFECGGKQYFIKITFRSDYKGDGVYAMETAERK